MAIGASVRQWRLRRALTQVELAKEVGISQNSLSRIETGEHTPRPTTVRKLAGALGVTIEELTAAGDGKVSGDAG